MVKSPEHCKTYISELMTKVLMEQPDYTGSVKNIVFYNFTTTRDLDFF